MVTLKSDLIWVFFTMDSIIVKDLDDVTHIAKQSHNKTTIGQGEKVPRMRTRE